MKILAVGDSVKLPTGYARVSGKILPYFVLKGHQVWHIGWGHHEPAEALPVQSADGKIVGQLNLLPALSADQFATEATVFWYNMIKPDMLYNSNDFFTSEPLTNRKKDMKSFLVNYGIIDGVGCAKCYQRIIKEIDVPVTPSMYGYEQLREVTDKGLYIPHGVDENIFKPSSVDKEVIKARFGLQGKFVYGALNRNIWRKQYPNLLKAFADLKYRDNVKDIAMFIIADPYDIQGNNIINWANYFNLTVSNSSGSPADIMLHPSLMNILTPLSDQQIVEAYNTFDVLVTASQSEGFGLPTLEAQACGVPVIACDITANTELIKGHGWLYPSAKNIDGSEIMVPPSIRDITYFYSEPDYAAMRLLMIEAYKKSEMLKNYGQLSLEFSKKYNWGKVLPLWDQVLDRVPK
jgi:glycosyltransferase involved in cell wall biosynthesis